MKAVILLVEDDLVLGQSLKEGLTDADYDVIWVTTAHEIVSQKLTRKVDAALLDVGLPDGDGFSVAQTLLTKRPELPVIFLTARTEAEDRLRGYELGAVDYIPKPFLLRELLLRLERVLEKTLVLEAANQAQLQVVVLPRGAVYDPAALAIKFADAVTEALQLHDNTILRTLIARAPSAISRDDLLALTWGKEGNPRSVDNAIVRLRTIFKRIDLDPIKSVRGLGYQWDV
ncbi:response regulator transcription factor [bacterium]|nr:response regulator transcription factor [bacterium]